MKPLVSVYCSTTRPTLLQETVKCFLDQDYPAKEMIILNDNPYMRLHLRGYPTIRVINTDQDFTSMAQKAHYLIDQCQGEFICSMDDDNLYTPWRLTDSVAYLQRRPELDGVRCDWSLTSINNNDIQIKPNNFEDTAMFRAGFLRSHRYEEGKNVTMSLILESQGKMDYINPFPLYWHVFRWGLGVFHLQGIKDEELSYQQSRAMAFLHNPHGDLFLKPCFFHDHWNKVYDFLNWKHAEHANTWKVKIRESEKRSA